MRLKLLWSSLADSTSTPVFPISVQTHGKLASLSDLWTLPVEDINWNGHEKGKTCEDRAGVFKRKFTRYLLVQRLAPKSAIWTIEPLRDAPTPAYMAATPAKKSRAKPFPPVAEAEYIPYDATMSGAVGNYQLVSWT